MKRFGAACAFALAVISLTCGCNDYGNTFQNPTGASLSAISPANASAGSGDLTLTLFGGGFVEKTVVQWNGKNLATTPVTDANSNILRLTALVPAALTANVGIAKVNTLNPHSGTTDNGLSNTLAFIINPKPNPLPELDSLAPNSAAPGGAAVTLTLTGKDFLPTSDPTGGSQVRWNANGGQTNLTIGSVSATQITATVSPDLLGSETCAVVSVYNPPAQATTPPSGVGNPYNGGGGTSSNGPGFFPGFAVSSDATFISNCTSGLSSNAVRHSALALAEETPALGADGRYVAYTASQNGHAQVFLRDTCTGAPAECRPGTALVSAAADGTPGNGDSNTPSMSSDGRFVAFSSAATNLA